MTQSRVADGLLKRFQFVPAAFGNQFHSAVGQIPDRARDFKSGGYGFHRIPKSDTLNPTAIKYMQPPPLHNGFLVTSTGVLCQEFAPDNSRFSRNEATILHSHATILFFYGNSGTFLRDYNCCFGQSSCTNALLLDFLARPAFRFE